MKAAVATVQSLLGERSVLQCAHTGVAAFNMGPGAETINLVFRFGSLVTDELVTALQDVQLLILDEISMVGSEQFAKISLRLEDIARIRWRRRNPADLLDRTVAYVGSRNPLGVSAGWRLSWSGISVRCPQSGTFR